MLALVVLERERKVGDKRIQTVPVAMHDWLVHTTPCINRKARVARLDSEPSFDTYRVPSRYEHTFNNKKSKKQLKLKIF